jgi:O-antigen biosynthesis protein WbqV
MNQFIRSPQAFVAFAHDLAMAAISFLAALYLRLGNWHDFATYFERLAPTSLPLFVACSAAVFAFMGLYRGVWRYASLDDVIAIVKAAVIVIALYLPLQFLLTRLEDLPRSQLFINWLVLVALLTGPRVAYRILRDRRVDNVLKRHRRDNIPVLLYGADDEAELFLRALARQRNTPYEAVGIIARKDSRVGRRIRGVEIYGTEERMAAVVDRLARRGRRPRRLIITSPEMDGEALRRLFERADALGMTVARVPRATDFREGTSDALELRPIAIEDLLGRPQTVLDRPAMKALCAGKRVLITGAGGSIGSELVRQVSDFGPARLALLDASEYQLYEIDLELARRHAGLPRAAVLADVRDARRVNAVLAAERPELVFHAAALKHVPMVEAHPDEGVLTNAVGTRIVADACIRHGVGAMVVISTDKAVNPSSVMGASKRLAEQYCQALDLAEAKKALGAGGAGGTHFITVRFGNVLGSTGSVVPLFQRQLAEGGPLTVTHPDVDRYFMTVREAVELVLMASAMGAAERRFSGKVFVLDMGQPVKIVELARQMIRLAGKMPERDIKIAFTGLRPGEKLREELLYAQEDLVATGVSGILLASPRTSDLKLLARAFDELERHARAGATSEALALLRHLVPEYRPAANGAADTSAAAP